MAKYVSLREAREQRREQKLYAAAGDIKAAKQEVGILSRQLLIKDFFVGLAALIILGIMAIAIVTPGVGILAIFWPVYLIIAFIISVLFILVEIHLRKKKEEMNSYKIKNNTALVATNFTIFLCILIPVVLLIIPVCFLLFLLFMH